MIQVSEEQIKDFLEKEFPGQPYSLGQGYWFVQAGKCLGKNLHYEWRTRQTLWRAVQMLTQNCC